jgi:transcription initiation factor TFIIE subunit beta
VQTRQAMLPDEINDACFVDVKNHKEVFESLKSNVKVSFDGQRFAFKVTNFLFYNPSFKFVFWVD